MESFEDILKSIPEKILIVLVDMLDFNKYHSFMTAKTGSAYESNFHKVQKEAELKGIIRTLDWAK